MDRMHKMLSSGTHEEPGRSSEKKTNPRRPDSPFPTVTDMVNNRLEPTTQFSDDATEMETIYYLDSPNLSTVSIENDYDMVSDVDIPWYRRTSTRDQGTVQQESIKTDLTPTPSAAKKLKSSFQRGPPLCEANMFGPLDWGLELMGAAPQPEPEQKPETRESERPSYSRQSTIEEVSYDGVVIYTIRRDIDERVHWPGTPTLLRTSGILNDDRISDVTYI